jgi:hypothetical protein
MLGSILPLLIKKIGLDPAVMASPFITTIIDVLSPSNLFPDSKHDTTHINIEIYAHVKTHAHFCFQFISNIFRYC